MSSKKKGIKDFMTMVADFHPEWSLLAIQSSIPEVMDILVNSLNYTQKDTSPIRIQATKKTNGHQKRGDFSNSIPIIKILKSSWVLIYSGVYHGNIFALNEISKFSRSLNCKAITLFQEDTSETMGYEFFDNGEQIERAEYSYGEENFIWKSKSNKKPKIKFKKDIARKENEESPKIILTPNHKLSDNDSQLKAASKDKMRQSNPKKLILSSTYQSPWFLGEDFNYDQSISWESDEEKLDDIDKISNENWCIWSNHLDSVFIDLNIYLPVIYPFNDNFGTYIEVEDSSAKYIEDISFILPQ
jgi:hypothetical protein